MDDKQKDNQAKESLDSSLEYDQASMPTSQAATPTPKPPKINKPKRMWSTVSRHSTIYLPIFVVLVIALCVVAFLIYRHQNSATTKLSEQTLSPQQLNSLAKSSETVGNANQVLTVESSSIFNGQVLVKGQLQVAGQLKVGSNLVLSGLNVSGSSQLNQLAVSGNGSIQGTLNVQNDLSVKGNGTFSGNLSAAQITVSSLQLNGNLVLNNHLVTGGSIPSQSTLGSVGGGGTTSVNGSDTAGTVTINTGSGPGSGCFVSVNFSTPFSKTPSVLLTPVGSTSAGLSYYVNRSSTSFSVCSANAPASGQTYVFDYLVVD